jgi:uncharacterized membrane protein
MNKQTLEQKIETMTSAGLFKWLVSILVVATIIIAAVFIVYFLNFKDGLSSINSDWGTFGDFIGGTLNPILSFLSLIALLVTIFLQSKELKLSRDELKLTRKELIKTAEAAKKQADHFEMESKRSDLYRLIEKLVERIDYNYKETFLFDGKTLFDIAPNNLRVEINQDEIDKLQRLYKNIGSLESNTIQLIERDFKRLLDYLKMYESTDDGRYLLEFYQTEYSDLMLFLQSQGMVSIPLYNGFCHSNTAPLK